MSKQYYVYVLARPDGTPFYVGKGQGKRILMHDDEARGGHQCHKCNVIRKIWKAGGEVLRYVVYETDDEQDAYQHERDVIAMYGLDTLANVANGGQGLSSPGERNPAAKLKQYQVDEIRHRYETEAIPLHQLATEYHVTYRTIISVVRRQHWDGPGALIERRPVDIRGALRRGEHSPIAELTWAEVHAIRARYVHGGISAEALGREYGVHQTCISKVVRNETWHDSSYTPPDDTRTLNRASFRGDKNGLARLSWEDVRTIRTRYATESITCQQLADEYGVIKSCIVKLIANLTWIDPDYTPPDKDRRYTTRQLLNREIAEEIRTLYATGEWSYARLGIRFNCSASAIVKIVKRETYT